jgi:anti-sigma factor RsiW
MHEELRLQLNAYLDGELHGRNLKEMQAHLDTCKTCRDELDQLRRLSDLLQADPGAETIPAERFVSQLMLRLPRRIPGGPARTRSPLPGWLVPAGLLGTWCFVQTVFVLTDAFSLADLTGLLGRAALWLGTGQESIWFSAAVNLLGGKAFISLPALSLLNNVSVFWANLFSGFLWQAVISVFYCAWLLIWWFRRARRPATLGSGS